MKVKNKFLATKGKVNLYDTFEEALRNTDNGLNKYVITVPLVSKSLDTNLSRVLIPYIKGGGIVDIEQLGKIYKSSRNFAVLKKLYEHETFCVVYINRFIKDTGESQYGILIENNNRYYRYITPVVADRGKYTDIAPYLKLLEICNQRGFHGIIRTFFPQPKVDYVQWDILEMNWVNEIITPIDIPFGMKLLNQILSGEEPMIPVYRI